MSPQLGAEFSTPLSCTPNDNFKTRTAKATFSQPSPCVTCPGFGATGWFCSYVTVLLGVSRQNFIQQYCLQSTPTPLVSKAEVVWRKRIKIIKVFSEITSTKI